MRHVCLAAVLVLVGTAPALADVTLKMTTSGQGATAGTPTTIYIKGNRMRSDAGTGAAVRTTIVDLDARKLYTFDAATRQASVRDLQPAAADAPGGSAASAATVAPNGRTMTLPAGAATGYDMKASAPMSLGPGAPEITAQLTGTVWVIPDAPGAADFRRFYQAAGTHGWTFGDTQAMKAQPAFARAIADMYRRMADIEGLPYVTEIQIAFSGTGQGAEVLSRVGTLTMRTVVESVATDALGDDLFMPPAAAPATSR